jgi:hypothetical protein
MQKNGHKYTFLKTKHKNGQQYMKMFSIMNHLKKKKHNEIYLTPIRMAIIKTLKITSAIEAREKGTLAQC